MANNQIRQTAIQPPDLTTGIRGVYGAAKSVPSALVGIGNQVSTRMGAPGFSGDAASTTMMPSGGGGDPRPYIANLPTPLRAGIARGRVLLNSLAANLKGNLRR